ncbi:hypothetical protein [Polynucleobacter sp. 15G-AUS-farblos]|uniref:hypothetical protein n=1 Tax=Polynucleobacter sp. 15G-AUS-farblos TaxID=2689094 RepID=UPI001C0BFD98|nr:hypothetical protein [Polynucleobacter sp. 15G-AUS-farblos]
MNNELKKYISDVFRKDVKQDKTSSILISEKKMLVGIPEDRNNKKFLLDRRYSLRLDEII